MRTGILQRQPSMGRVSITFWQRYRQSSDLASSFCDGYRLPRSAKATGFSSFYYGSFCEVFRLRSRGRQSSDCRIGIRTKMPGEPGIFCYNIIYYHCSLTDTAMDLVTVPSLKAVAGKLREYLPPATFIVAVLLSVPVLI